MAAEEGITFWQWLAGAFGSIIIFVAGTKARILGNKKTEVETRNLTAEQRRNQFNDLESAWEKIALLTKRVEELQRDLNEARKLIEQLQIQKTLSDTFFDSTKR